ncbi:MAG: hypothetical protein KatS3mg059_0672 [Thermomicrobiales bacterium]|nr:MAG: hypothetical protein KatS3mg059_0672 [Thermomicrobiales bacterium]
MTRYILGRLVSLVFVLFAVSLIAFLLMHSVPGGPFDLGERRLPEATRQAQLRKYGLDQPIYVQYVRFIWHALHGDFGVSFQRADRDGGRADREPLASNDQGRRAHGAAGVRGRHTVRLYRRG